MLLREENQYARYIHANTSLLDLNADVQIPSSNADVDISTKAKKNIASKSISKKYWVCESIPPNTQPESQNPLSFDHLEIPKYKTIIPPISSTTAAENRAKTSEPGQIDKNISRKLISRELQSASKQPRVETGFKSSIRKKSSRRRRKEAERILACVTRLHSAIKRLPSPKKPVVLSNLNLCTFTNINKLSKANEKIDGCEKSTYESILEMSGGTETKTQNAKALEQASDNVNETVFSKAQNTVQKIRSHVQPLKTQKISIYESASPTIIPLKTNFVHSADEKLLIEFTTTPPSKDRHNECDSNGMKEVCEIIDQNLKDHIIDKQTQRESTSEPKNLSLNGLQVQSIVKSSKLDRSNAYRKRIHGIHRRYGRLRRRVKVE
ncbi:hypothetical protein HK098_004040 [Nowakowskiella sp. JEL0407]|nr:hypothetical protein HK098_004040 [Nowakowskiella sp. JEL0407]